MFTEVGGVCVANSGNTHVLSMERTTMKVQCSSYAGLCTSSSEVLWTWAWRSCVLPLHLTWERNKSKRFYCWL